MSSENVELLMGMKSKNVPSQKSETFFFVIEHKFI